MWSHRVVQQIGHLHEVKLDSFSGFPENQEHQKSTLRMATPTHPSFVAENKDFIDGQSHFSNSVSDRKLNMILHFRLQLAFSKHKITKYTQGK